MVIREADRTLARSEYMIACALIAKRDPAAADLAQAAMDHPSPMTARALVEAGYARAWQPMLYEALAQVGIAGISDVLGGGDAE